MRESARGGRKAFRDLAPAGFHLGMMEPGEAETLLRIRGDEMMRRREELGLPADAPVSTDYVDRDAFIRDLLANEVFTVRKSDGVPLGYATANEAGEIYWLAEVAVEPGLHSAELRACLVQAVLRRAAWFFHRALGLSTDEARSTGAPFYQSLGFVRAELRTAPPWMIERLAAETPPGFDPAARTAMVRWL